MKVVRPRERSCKPLELYGDFVSGYNIPTRRCSAKATDPKEKGCDVNKSNLEVIYNLKFLDNSEEFSDCVKRMHLRDIEALEYCKRREPLIMKGKRGYGEEEVIHPLGISIDDTSNEVFVADYYKALVYVYSSERDFIRKFGQ